MLKERLAVIDDGANATVGHRLGAQHLHHRRQRAVLAGEDAVQDADAQAVDSGVGGGHFVFVNTHFEVDGQLMILK